VPRTAKPQISFADWELLQQGVLLEPVLQSISDFLDDHEEMIEAVRRDLERGLKNPGTGRNGLAPKQVLRSLILRRIKNWDYRELRERIADGYTLRQFTDFYCQPVPRHDAFNRAFNRLTPQTLKAVNELVVQAAVDVGLEDGQTLRVDSTVDVATLCYTSLSLRKHYLLPLATLLLRNPRLIPEIGGLFADRF
jgi:IS5 family transposase